MGLFKPAWESSDPLKRMKGIRKLNDQEKLMKIAATDMFIGARIAAIKRITDEAFLTQLCIALEHRDISEVCLDKIKSKPFLLLLALNDKSGIASDWLVKLEPSLNEEELRLLVFQSVHYKVQYRVVELAKNDKSLLLEILLKHPNGRINDRANDFVDDYDMLLEATLKGEAGTAQKCLKKLKYSLDKADLRAIIFNATDLGTQRKAIDFIDGDVSLLSDILLKHPEEQTRNLAASSIREHKTPGVFRDVVFEYVGREKPYYGTDGLLQRVIADLNQEDVLRVALDSSITARAREVAVENLQDKASLTKAVFDEKDVQVQVVMIRCISDDDVLWSLYQQTQNEKVKLAIIKAMTDEKMLAQIAKDDKQESACLKLGGYLCTSCHGINLPMSGQDCSCICKHCQAENHIFVEKSHVTGTFRDHETFEEWNECTRCGVKRNYRSDYRYTDW